MTKLIIRSDQPVATCTKCNMDVRALYMCSNIQEPHCARCHDIRCTGRRSAERLMNERSTYRAL